MNKVKIVFFVPTSDADKVRNVVGEASGGKIGNYSHCSFSIKGEGRFKPEKGANPAVGKVGRIEITHEERVEFVCEKSVTKKILQAIRKVHPYEEVDFDIYPLISEEDL